MVTAFYERVGKLIMVGCYLEGVCHEEAGLDGLCSDCLDGALPGK